MAEEQRDRPAWEVTYLAERTASGWDTEVAELGLRMLHPTYRTAFELVELLGLEARPPEARGPLFVPRRTEEGVKANAAALGSYLWHAGKIYRDLQDMKAATSGKFVLLNSLIQAVVATRPWGDLKPADLGLEDEDQERWLIPLALALAATWRMYEPQDKQQLAALAELRSWTPVEVKVDLVLRAIPLVQGSREESQAVKLGRSWVKDDSRKKRQDVIPVHELDRLDYLKWWRARVYDAATSFLYVETGTRPTDVPDSDVPDDAEIHSHLLDALDATERHRAAVEQLDDVGRALDDVESDLSAGLTKDQGKVLAVLVRNVQAGNTYAEAKREAAAELGMDTVNAIEMHLSRIRQRLRA